MASNDFWREADALRQRLRMLPEVVSANAWYAGGHTKYLVYIRIRYIKVPEDFLRYFPHTIHHRGEYTYFESWMETSLECEEVLLGALCTALEAVGRAPSKALVARLTEVRLEGDPNV